MNRYNDAATVSDEHGKGVEILRQQVAVGLGSVAEDPLMVAEVDMIIRNIKVASNGVDPAAGTVQFWYREPGAADSARVALTGSQAVSGMSANDVLDIPLTSSLVPKDHIVEVTIASLTNLVRLSVIVGWMPDMWAPDSIPRTF